MYITAEVHLRIKLFIDVNPFRLFFCLVSLYVLTNPEKPRKSRGEKYTLPIPWFYTHTYHRTSIHNDIYDPLLLFFFWKSMRSVHKLSQNSLTAETSLAINESKSRGIPLFRKNNSSKLLFSMYKSFKKNNASKITIFLLNKDHNRGKVRVQCKRKPFISKVFYLF